LPRKISGVLEENLREIVAISVVGLAWICVWLGFGFGFVGKFLPWAVGIVALGGAVVLGRFRMEKNENLLEKLGGNLKKKSVLANLLGAGLLLWPVAVLVEKYLAEPLRLVRLVEPVALGAVVLGLLLRWRRRDAKLSSSRARPGNQKFSRETGQIFGVGELLFFVAVAVGTALRLRDFGSVAVVVAGFARGICVFLARVMRDG
jgi:hypothetical protein